MKENSRKGLGVVLAVVGVLCGTYIASPVDFSPAMFGIDDIGSLIAMIAAISGAVKSFSNRKSIGSGDSSTK